MQLANARQAFVRWCVSTRRWQLVEPACMRLGVSVALVSFCGVLFGCVCCSWCVPVAGVLPSVQVSCARQQLLPGDTSLCLLHVLLGVFLLPPPIGTRTASTGTWMWPCRAHCAACACLYRDMHVALQGWLPPACGIVLLACNCVFACCRLGHPSQLWLRHVGYAAGTPPVSTCPPA